MIAAGFVDNDIAVLISFAYVRESICIVAAIAELVFADTSHVVASLALLNDELAVRTPPEIKDVLEEGNLLLETLTVMFSTKTVQAKKIIASVAFEGIFVE